MRARAGAFVYLLTALLAARAEPAGGDDGARLALWPNGAPGSEARRGEPELAGDWWVRNVHDPSVTAFLPEPAKATGAAVVIFPGGGHENLVWNSEGRKPAEFLRAHGIAAFAVKYRLGRGDATPYSIEEHARADALRALRLVRHRAAEFGIDPRRIGVLGFSAGGELASFVSYGDSAGDPAADDPVDRESARPDFQMVVYPGPLGAPALVPPSAPPAFFLVANDDAEPSRVVTALLAGYRAAGVPVEVHLYARGGHAFNLGDRSPLRSIRDWPSRMLDWLADNGWLDDESDAGGN